MSEEEHMKKNGICKIFQINNTVSRIKEELKKQLLLELM